MKKISLKFAIIVEFLFIALFFYSCSVNSFTSKDDSSMLPDFYFENLVITRVENGKVSSKLHAGELEQYNSSKSSFARGVDFQLFNDARKLTVEGRCDYLSLDSDQDIYTMFDKIEITSYEQNLKVMSDGLKWNNQTEQLTSPKNYSVTITNDIAVPENAVKSSSENNSDSKMLFTGKEFSASGVSNRYSFGSRISGKVDVDSEDGEVSGEELVEDGETARDADAATGADAVSGEDADLTADVATGEDVSE
ncbi:MAG: LPS export ABC transporter periplasmic protein LptC [Treponemataceae bacterium]|nr:LPS export ABC transporter periplasmic protein LptC [Treponemataceae bacterium]